MQPFRQFFEISYPKAWALAILCIAIVLGTVVYFLIPSFYKPVQITDKQKQVAQQLAAHIQVDTSHKSENQYQRLDTNVNYKASLFKFDPNTITVNQFMELGCSEKLAHTIENYRNKGGVFYKKESLKKIWGFPEALYQRLEPYVEIQLKTNSSFTPQRIEIVEINTADTAQLNKLPMIGATLSQRIVDRRKELGGYFDKLQLKEIYGLSEETYQLISSRIKVNTAKIKTININTVLFQDLNHHPYFRNGLALSILKLRRQKGSFTGWDDIRNEIEISTTDFQKIKNYITFK